MYLSAKGVIYAVPPFFFTHQSYQTLSGNGDKSWELTYLHFPFLHIVQFSGSKATFHAPSFKWPFSRWAILSFKGTACTPLCLYLFPICYVPNISHGSEFCQDEFFITLPLYEVSCKFYCNHKPGLPFALPDKFFPPILGFPPPRPQFDPTISLWPVFCILY